MSRQVPRLRRVAELNRLWIKAAPLRGPRAEHAALGRRSRRAHKSRRAVTGSAVVDHVGVPTRERPALVALRSVRLKQRRGVLLDPLELAAYRVAPFCRPLTRLLIGLAPPGRSPVAVIECVDMQSACGQGPARLGPEGHRHTRISTCCWRARPRLLFLPAPSLDVILMYRACSKSLLLATLPPDAKMSRSGCFIARSYASQYSRLRGSAASVLTKHRLPGGRGLPSHPGESLG